jgi:deoxyribodipyrimidine photo-lyase
MTTRAIVWFRRDLRLGDNPAWSSASHEADRITALYVLDPALRSRAGPFRLLQLLAHLHALDESLQQHGGRLLVRHGRPTEVVPALADALGARYVYANADVTPYARRRDAAVSARLGGALTQSWGNLVHQPGAVVTAKGRTSRVFTPFFQRWARTPFPVWPESTSAIIDGDSGDGLSPVEGEPFQSGGEAAALDRLCEFADRADDYADARDIVAKDGTSMLSADLRFGTLSPRTVVRMVGTAGEGRVAFVRQLAWRDWYAHLLWEIPSFVDTAMRAELDAMAWENDPADIAAWKEGRTGFPIVDAGMRQLSATGWLPNRVRMIAASFLVKDLLVDWRIGERWFRHLLVDADVAQNVGNWQWVAGTGPDAAPYFRILNPVLQSRKFDPLGDYIRRFVPELGHIPARWIHAPFDAPRLELDAAGVQLGATYPYPIIDHANARTRTLAVYGQAARSTVR